MVEFVPATAELATAFYGKPAPFSFRGWVCMVDGEPAGVCGIYKEGIHNVAFSDIAPGHRGRRRDIVRGIRLMREVIEASPVPVFAKPNPEFPTARPLLERLGFVPAGDLMVHL